MKTLLAIITLAAASAQAQYWTTNTTTAVVTNTVTGYVTNANGSVFTEPVQVVQTITNEVITPILVTNNVKCVLTAQDEANLRELFGTLKDDGQVTGTFNAWFDTTANEAVARAMTSKSGELPQVKQDRILRLWNKATLAQQTNVISILK